MGGSEWIPTTAKHEVKEDAEVPTTLGGADSTIESFERLPAFIDLPEAIVGTHDTFSIGLPKPAGSSAEVLVVVPELLAQAQEFGGPNFDGRSVFLADGTARVLTNKSVGAPINIRFAPKESGRCTATLVLNMRHQDGRTEERKVVLNFRARDRDQAPLLPTALTPSITSPSQNMSDAASKKAPLVPSDMLGSQVVLMTMAQKDGITAAEGKAAFHRKPTDVELWLKFVGFAVETGIGAAAGSVAGKIEKAFLDHAAAKAEGLSPELMKAATENVALASKRAAEGVKTLISLVGKQAGAGVVALGKIAAPTDVDEFRADFFYKQKLGIDDAAKQMLAAFSEHKTAIDSSMMAVPVTGGLDASELAQQVIASNLSDVANLQQQASAIAWIDLIAQSTQGTVDTVDPDYLHPQKVTNMKESDREKPYEHADGVLELYVSGENEGDEIEVHAAYLYGVSRGIGHQLLDVPLINQQIPIRIAQTTRSIDVDESGRVTVVTGPFLPKGDAGIRNAEKVASIVLSRSLSKWGVKEVKSDAK